MSIGAETEAEITAAPQPTVLSRLSIVCASLLAAQQGRAVLWMPVGLATGIGAYFLLRFEPPAIFCYAALVAAGVCWGLCWPLRQRGGFYGLATVAISALLLLSLGFAAAKYRSDSVAGPVLERPVRIATVIGTVSDIDMLQGQAGQRVVLRDLEIERLAPEATPQAVRIRVRAAGDDYEMRIGDRVSVLAGLNPPSAPVMPRAFDFQRYAWFQQIGAFGFAYKPPELIAAQEPDAAGLRLEALRQQIGAKIRAALGSGEIAHVAAALLSGERAGISEAGREAMRDSGLAHMLAISGLHVGLAAGILFMFARLIMACFPGFALHHPIKKYAAALALLGAVGYTLLVGAPVSAVRASIMTGIVLIAVMLDRQAISLRLVALAACAVLLLTPEALTGASFQMSFAAVTGLVYFYDKTRHRWADAYRQSGAGRRLLLYFAGVSATTIIATLATAPFSLFHFQQLAWYSLLANFIAVPVLSFIVMPALVLALLVMPLGLSGPPLLLAGLGIGWILSIAHEVASLPGATWNPAMWPLPGLVALVAAALFYMLWQGRGRVLALLPLVAAVVFITEYKQPDILISSSGKLSAVRLEDGRLALSGRVAERFVGDNWLRLAGQAADDKPRWIDQPAAACDEWGCMIPVKGRVVAFSNHESAHAQDCRAADIVISSVPLRRRRDCAASPAIGFFELYRADAHALWLEPDGAVRVETVQGTRGQRPWAVNNRR